MLLTDYFDRREWNLDGHEVTQLCISFSLFIQVWGEESELTRAIHVPFRLLLKGREETLDPENGATLGPALQILHKPVESLAAFRNGDLTLRFADGTAVRVEKDWNYETWETTGSGKLSDIGMLCSPHDGPPWME